MNRKYDALKLNKALYGLRKAPRAWNETFDGFAQKNNLKRSGYYFCLNKEDKVWLLLWVDDIIITGPHSDKIIKDLGNIKHFLGMKIVTRENIVTISQNDLIDKMF